jgi:serine protease Do
VRIDSIGAEVAELTAEAAERLGYRENVRGVVLTAVDRDSIAVNAGLRAGVVITKVERQPVATTAEFKERLAAADLARGALLQIQTPLGGAGYVVLRSGSK